jgi:uncharacterized LabA/DUF88 family protein
MTFMSNTALFVDLPNFYSRLLKSGAEDTKILRDYFLEWLDFDLLARSLSETYAGIWIFYSGERIGPSSERIDGKYLQDYISKINSVQGVTARNVNIPGEQREPLRYKCENCGREGTTQAISEKGIDASLTVHMFDTIDSWDTAYLFSGDADFVPAVESLRRRGKIVIGVGFHDASPALVRECYDYIFLEDTFIRQDLLLYLVFRKGGIAEKWLIDEVKPSSSNTKFSQTYFSIHFAPVRGNGFHTKEFISANPNLYHIDFVSQDIADMIGRDDMMMSLAQKYRSTPRLRPTGDYGQGSPAYRIDYLDSTSQESIYRHLGILTGGIEKLNFERYNVDEWHISATYAYDQTVSKYHLAHPN